MSFSERQGGLPTLRLEVNYAAALPDSMSGTVELSYRDDNELDRIGWREIVARPGNQQTHIEQASVPQQDTCNELRSYPGDLLVSPLAVRTAQLTYVPGGAAPVSKPDQRNPALAAISHTQTQHLPG